MSNIYIVLSLSLFCVILAFIIASKLILVTVFCVILACVYFKDDLTFLRYLSTHVSLIYLWCFEFWSYIQNMYHQSNSSNFPARKCIQSNGSLTNKQNRLHHRVKSNITHNFNSSYGDAHPTSTKANWSSGSNIPVKTTPKQLYYPLEQNSSVMDVSHINRPRSIEYSIDLGSGINSNSQVPMPVTPRLITPARVEDSRNKYIESVNLSNYSPASDRLEPRNDDRPLLDAQLFANVNSPGFCSRIAERLSENMTHQQKYESVGAFPVVHLKSQSPMVKVKTPVRVRLAPSTSKDLMFTNMSTNSIPRPSLIGGDESMKSVLQVLKEISRKRIHSHVDDDCDENSKRLRVSESQFICESDMHVSLLQQTFQGKRAREDSSPNEADAKKRRRSIQNNEISSSLSSSKSVKAPHLQPQKRKAQAIEDSYSNTPVLGKLLKVQTEVTPPLKISSSPTVLTLGDELKTSPLPVTPTSESKSVEEVSLSEPEPATIKKANCEFLETNNEDKVVSRLLGRMSNQAEPTFPQEINVKKNVFISTNDLSLSPPKENRLAAMIAVLGGPNNNQDIDLSDNLKQTGNDTLSKDLFMSPSTQDTPKANKKVTFNDSLTTTKVYDKNQSGIGENQDQKTSSDVSHLMPLSPKTSSETSVRPNLQFSIKDPNTTAPSASFSFSSSPLTAGNLDAIKQNKDSASVKSTIVSTSASPINITNSVSLQQSSTPFTPSSSSDSSSASPVASNYSLPAIENAKPFDISFGIISYPDINKKESIGGNTLSFDSTKILSVDKNLRRPQAVLCNPGKNTFLVNIKKELTKMTSSDTAKSLGENKNSISLFSNKDSIGTEVSLSHSKNKPLVNGVAPTTNISSSPFAFNASATPASLNKSESPIFGTNLSSSPTAKSSSAAFIATSKASNGTITESSSVKESLSGNQQVQPFTVFSSVTGNTSQPDQSLLENKFRSPSNASVFEDQASNIGSYKTQSTTQASFLSLGNSGFGSSTTVQSNTTSTTTTIAQSNSIFGNVSSNTTPKQNIFNAIGSSIVQPQSQIFESSMASTTSQSNNGFCPPLTQSPGLFGNVQLTTNPQNSTLSTSAQSFQQPSLLREGVNDTQVSKPLFQTISNPTSAFGTMSNNPSTTGFETQSTNSFVFGNRANIVTSPFENSTRLNFGGQTNNNLITTHNSFTHPVETSTPAKNLSNANAPASSLSSPFVFGSPSTNTDQAKPCAAAKPFSFGSQQSSLGGTNTSQLSVASFNSASSGFGVNSQPPAFSSVIPQSATPVFAFGQSSTSAPNFQFNTGGSQPVGGGMFNIGSGSTAPRNKTSSLRRRNK